MANSFVDISGADDSTKSAITILHYKLTKISSPKYRTMGLFGLEQAEESLLPSFSKEDVEVAVRNSVKLGELRMFYLKDCPHCATPNIYEEEDSEDLTTFSHLHSGGQPCTFCNRKITFEESIGRVEKKFCVLSDTRSAQELLDAVDEEEERWKELQAETLWQRIKRWLTPKPADNKEKNSSEG